MGRIEVITGRERRRAWSEAQKRAIVAAAFAPGAVVTQVARRADVNASLIYRWRREQRVVSAGFTPVVVTPDPPADVAEAGCTAIEIDIAGVARLRIPTSAPPALAAAVLDALVRR